MVNTLSFVQGNIETNFATNTLGTFILTMCLLRLLAQSTHRPRVIAVSSGGMLLQKLEPTINYHNSNADLFDGQMVYAQNKRQQVSS
jgi:dehydrogenase/reductase SDR family protein 12